MYATPTPAHLSVTAFFSRPCTGGHTFCSTANPTAKHFTPPGPATSDAVCKPSKADTGDVEVSPRTTDGSGVAVTLERATFEATVVISGSSAAATATVGTILVAIGIGLVLVVGTCSVRAFVSSAVPLSCVTFCTIF